jgi:hypothetical protein
MLKCHCACSSEIGICIINDIGRQAAHKKQQKFIKNYRISPNNVLYSYILTFNAKKKLFEKSLKSTT